MNELCTLTKALEYSKEGRLEEWIHMFLHHEGNNIEFSEGLKLEKRYFKSPIKMSLDLFERCCGPEENIKYQIDEANFNKRVNAIMKRAKEDWDMPPLIINYCGGKFELNDGNHRYEALKRNGIKEYYVIIWITSYDDYQKFNRIYENSY